LIPSKINKPLFDGVGLKTIQNEASGMNIELGSSTYTQFDSEFNTKVLLKNKSQGGYSTRNAEYGQSQTIPTRAWQDNKSVI